MSSGESATGWPGNRRRCQPQRTHRTYAGCATGRGCHGNHTTPSTPPLPAPPHAGCRTDHLARPDTTSLPLGSAALRRDIRETRSQAEQPCCRPVPAPGASVKRRRGLRRHQRHDRGQVKKFAANRSGAEENAAQQGVAAQKQHPPPDCEGTGELAQVLQVTVNVGHEIDRVPDRRYQCRRQRPLHAPPSKKRQHQRHTEKPAPPRQARSRLEEAPATDEGRQRTGARGQ